MFLCLLATTCLFFFFFNDTATTEIYTLSLHDALPIFVSGRPPRLLPSHHSRRILLPVPARRPLHAPAHPLQRPPHRTDRKSTRLNSSHSQISYAVFCLKKKQTRWAQPQISHAPSPSLP